MSLSRLIYKLCLDTNLQWVYGGEHAEFSASLEILVEAWLSVGLKPYFVFDGERIRVLCCRIAHDSLQVLTPEQNSLQ